MKKEIQGYHIELGDLPNSQVVDRVRARLFSRVTKKLPFYREDNIIEINYRQISWGACTSVELHESLRLPEAELLMSVGLDVVGCAVADVYPLKGDPVLEYVAVVLADGTSFEALTTKVDQQLTFVYKNGKVLGKILSEWHQTKPRFLGPYRNRWELYLGDTFFGQVNMGKLFSVLGKKFYLKDYVTRDSLCITRDDGTLLPIHLYRKDRIVDFFIVLFRILTLYPLWAAKSWLVNEDTVIPKNAPQITDPDLESFYFMIGIVFRIVFFDMAFSYEMTS